PALAQGLAEVFALELDQQLRAALSAWPRASAAATRAAACHELSRIFHTIKGGAGLAGRAELAEAARALERFFADPAAADTPPRAALERLFAAASLPAPRLDPLSRSLTADAAPASRALLIPLAVGADWLAVRLDAVRRAALVAFTDGDPPPLDPTCIDLRAVLGLAAGRGRAVALALHGGATLIGDRVLPPASAAVAPPHRLLACHPWLAGTAVDAQGRPLCVLDVARLVAAHAPVDAGAPPSAAVLVVDDSLVAREAAALALRAVGVGVDLARDGREALAKLGRASYAVVLSDLEMPHLDGFGLIAEMRASAAWKQQPVVVCSSRLDAEARRRLDPLGVAGFVAKPFAADELLAALQPWLELEGGPAAAPPGALL
ncbi:MAG: response regulator, partial [Deltaproteobacteria bacterium]|nr:response regulator [Deltaproteobacteria bacterium]